VAWIQDEEILVTAKRILMNRKDLALALLVVTIDRKSVV
jgi:hypothetical protein